MNGGDAAMMKRFTRTSKPAAVAVLLLGLIGLVGSIAVPAAGEVDCGAALSRCLSELSWWEQLINPDYCLVGLLFCLLYMK
jgi:hypothetical protein